MRYTGNYYVQGVPINFLSFKRKEDSLHETLSAAITAIFKHLGHLFSDTELNLLLSTYQSNLSSNSATIRRCSSEILLSLCQYCRKKSLYHCCTNTRVLETLQRSTNNNEILGCLTCLRILSGQLFSNMSSDHSKLLVNQALTFVYVSIYYISTSSNPSVITASLELLRAVLDNAPLAMVTCIVTASQMPSQKELMPKFNVSNDIGARKYQSSPKSGDKTRQDSASPKSGNNQTNEEVNSDDRVWLHISKETIKHTGMLHGIGIVSGESILRWLCARFLLAGYSGSLISSKTVRISWQIIALHCVARLILWLPYMILQPLYPNKRKSPCVSPTLDSIPDSIEKDGIPSRPNDIRRRRSTSNEEDELDFVQKIFDVTRYCNHSDPSLVSVAASVVGNYTSAMVEQVFIRFS